MPNFFQTVSQKQISIRSSNRMNFSPNQVEQKRLAQEALTFRIKAFELYDQANRLKSEFEGIRKKFKSSEELLKDTLSYNLYLSKARLAEFYEFYGKYYLLESAQAGDPESLNFVLLIFSLTNQDEDQERKYLLVHPLNDTKIIEISLKQSNILLFYYTFDALKLAEIDISNTALESYFEKFCEITPIGLECIRISEKEYTVFRQKNKQFIIFEGVEPEAELYPHIEKLRVIKDEFHETLFIKIVERFSTLKEFESVFWQVCKIAADRGSSLASSKYSAFVASDNILLAIPYILQACLMDSQGKNGEQVIRMLDEILTDTSMFRPPIKDQMIAQLTIATIIRKQEVPQEIKKPAKILFDKLEKSKSLYSIEILMREGLNVTDSIDYFVLNMTREDSVQRKLESMKMLKQLLLNQTTKLSTNQRMDVVLELVTISLDKKQDQKIIRAAEEILVSELEKNKCLYDIKDMERSKVSFSLIINYLSVCHTLDVNHYFHVELVDNCDFILKSRQDKITKEEKEQLNQIISDITSDLEAYKEKTFIRMK